MMCWSCSVIHVYYRGVEGTVVAKANGNAWSSDSTVHWNILWFRQHYTGESYKSEEHLQNREQDIGLTYSSVLLVC